jgi:hypothetical protein
LAIDFISPDGFYNWEAIASGEVIATIAYDPDDWSQRYVVAVGEGEIHRCNTQSKAESYIRWHYTQGTLPVIEVEKPEPCTIEDCSFVDEKGQRYIFRINNQIIGYIWLSSDDGWIFDNNYYDDWRDCGLALAQLTRNDLYELVAA